MQSQMDEISLLCLGERSPVWAASEGQAIRGACGGPWGGRRPWEQLLTRPC